MSRNLRVKNLKYPGSFTEGATNTEVFLTSYILNALIVF